MSPNSNPYHHDMYNCGGSLRNLTLKDSHKDWEIMGMWAPNSFQLINKVTGERWVIDLR